MSPRNLAEVLIGVLSLWLIASSLPVVPFVLPVLRPEPFVEDAIFAWVPNVASLAISLTLGAVGIRYRRRISQLFPETPADLTGSPEDLERVGLALLGVYLVVGGLVRLVPYGSSLIREHGLVEALQSSSGSLLQILLGLLLALRPAGVAGLLRSLRTAGRN